MVAGPDRAAALAVIEELWQQGLSDEGRLSSAAVIDLDSDRRTCPACLATYAAGPLACPECGLYIGA